MAKKRYPKESTVVSGESGRGGMALVHFVLNPSHWQYREETGPDVGKDVSFEYINEHEWHDGIIRGQVKGTRILEKLTLKKEQAFSWRLDKKTINYALNSKDAFLLFVGDLNTNRVYYLPIQDFFIANPEAYEVMSKGTKSMTLHIPFSNEVTRENDGELVELTKASYSLKDGRVIKATSSN